MNFRMVYSQQKLTNTEGTAAAFSALSGTDALRSREEKNFNSTALM